MMKTIDVMSTMPAILVSDIEFKCLSGEIKFVPANTYIKVDKANSIALIAGHHVHIDYWEYKILYC